MLQPKSRAQDYMITSRSAIWLQNSNCARTWANTVTAKSKMPRKCLFQNCWLTITDSACQEWVLKDKLDKQYAQCVACKIQLFFYFYSLNPYSVTVAMVLTKSNISPYSYSYKSLYKKIRSLFGSSPSPWEPWGHFMYLVYMHARLRLL